MDPGLVRIAGQRFSGELGAFLEAAVLAGNQCEIIKRVGISRINAQHIVVARGSFVDGAAPMQCQTFLQQLAGRGRGHGGEQPAAEANRHAGGRRLGGHGLAVTAWRSRLGGHGLAVTAWRSRLGGHGLAVTAGGQMTRG